MTTSHFYVFQDQYGWAVATTTGAPFASFLAAHNGPRTFATRADAQNWIYKICEAA